MTLPAWRDWAFALKVAAAAVLALFLALWIDLPRPYWAISTIFITSQPLAGATRSKAFYRVYGTLLGAVVPVILVPNLVNAPELLTLAIALWVAVCLYFSLLDRTPRSYVLMLGGYTAARRSGHRVSPRALVPRRARMELLGARPFPHERQPGGAFAAGGRSHRVRRARHAAALRHDGSRALLGRDGHASSAHADVPADRRLDCRSDRDARAEPSSSRQTAAKAR
jgi:uncharacterized membrane protein YccC